MRKVYILAGLTVALVIAAITAGFGLSTGWAVKSLASAVVERLGRKLEVKGGTGLEFSPSLAIRFEAVTLGPADGFDGPLVTAEELRIPLTIGDLLQHRLPDDLLLTRPVVSLEVNTMGNVSWSAPGEKLASRSPATFRIEDGTIRFYDQRNSQSLEISEANLAATLSPEGELNLDGASTLGGRLTSINAYIKDLSRIASSGSPFDLALDNALLKVALNGRVSTRDSLNLAGSAELSGDSLKDVAKWLGTPIGSAKGFGAFAASGTLETSGPAITLRDASASLDNLQARGDIGITASRIAPEFFAKLMLPRLDLNAYADYPAIAGDDWSTGTLSYDNLRGFNGRVTLLTDQLSFGPATMQGAGIEASLAGGRLAAVITGNNLAGGKARIDLELDSTSAAPLFSARLIAENAEAEKLLPAFTGQGWITGKASADVSLSGYGTSVQAIVSTLKGAATFKVADGSLVGLDLRALLSAVTQKIVTGWTIGDGKATAIPSLSASFAIADGIAATKDLAVDAGGLTFSGEGQVDLLRRAVDLAFMPKIDTGGGAAAALPVPIRVSGAWIAPKIYPDMPDMLMKPEEAFAKLKSMGLPEAPAGN